MVDKLISSRPWASVQVWCSTLACWMTYPQWPGQFQGPLERAESGQWPNSWKSPPFPKIAGIFLLLTQFSTVTLCDPMDCSTPAFPVHHIGLWNSVQFTHTVVSNSLWPHGLQHAMLSSPSQTPATYPNSCPLSWWCHVTISSSVVPFSSHLQSVPASESFPMSQLLASGGQSIGASASASVLPRYIQDWFPLGWTGWISLQSEGLSRGFSNITDQKHQFFGSQLSLWSNTHIHTWLL